LHLVTNMTDVLLLYLAVGLVACALFSLVAAVFLAFIAELVTKVPLGFGRAYPASLLASTASLFYAIIASWVETLVADVPRYSALGSWVVFTLLITPGIYDVFIRKPVSGASFGYARALLIAVLTITLWAFIGGIILAGVFLTEERLPPWLGFATMLQCHN